jgi:hypothetical protein
MPYPYQRRLIDGIIAAARESHRPEPTPEVVPAEEAEAAAIAAFRRALSGDPREAPEEKP